MAKDKNLQKKICFYTVATHLGGAEKSLLDLVCELSKNPESGYLPLVLVPKSEGPLIDRLQSLGIAYLVLKMPTLFLKVSRGSPGRSFLFSVYSIPSLILYCWRLIRLLKKADIALVHSNSLKCHYLSGILAPWIGKPVIWHFRDLWVPGMNRSFMRFLRRAVRVFVIANSNATAQSFDPSENISVIYNGLDPAIYFPNKNSKYRTEFQIPQNVPVIGMVGVFSRWKGQLDFVEMAAGLVAQGHDLRFVLVGDMIYDTVSDGKFTSDPYKLELQKKIQNLGLSQVLFLAGFEKSVELAFNSLDIAIHASNRPEPFGRVILEAMACGVPVVASRAGGVLELIEDGKTGTLFTAGNVKELTQAVGSLLQDSQRRKETAGRARERFLAEFTLEAHLRGILEFYDRILRTP